VLYFFLAVVAEVTQQEEDGTTKAEIVKDRVHSWPIKVTTQSRS
jgi:hypothetical protein